MSADQIEWRAIPGHPEHEVSSTGRVRRVGGREVRPRYSGLKKKYLFVDLCREGRTATRLVNRLVALAFLGPPPTAHHQAAHWDGNPGNNTVENLRWATPLENEQDKRRHGNVPAGERNGSAKLTATKVREIRSRFRRISKKRSNCHSLAAEFGVRWQTIQKIVSGETWRAADIEPPPGGEEGR